MKCEIDAKLLLPIMYTVTLCGILFYFVLRKSINPEVKANKIILCEEGRESFLHTDSITLLANTPFITFGALSLPDAFSVILHGCTGIIHGHPPAVFLAFTDDCSSTRLRCGFRR